MGRGENVGDTEIVGQRERQADDWRAKSEERDWWIPGADSNGVRERVNKKQTELACSNLHRTRPACSRESAFRPKIICTLSCICS